MAEELRIGHFFKRLLTVDSMFGNSDYHLQKVACTGTSQTPEGLN